MKLTKEKKLKLKESSLRKWGGIVKHLEGIVKHLEEVMRVVNKSCGYCSIYFVGDCATCPLNRVCMGEATDCCTSTYRALNSAKIILKAIQKNVNLTRARGRR